MEYGAYSLIESDTFLLTRCVKTLQATGHFDEYATSNFRLIDLEIGCIRRAPLHTRYLTLSYVWGQLPMFKTQKSNYHALMTENGLTNIRPYLPRTINDAIDLVGSLGERYLWIDSLCLIQDDEQDVKLGIELMNSIYEGSFLTIVAGSGIDANAGLLGFNAKPRCAIQPIEELNAGLRMTVLHSIDKHLNASPYNGRAWT